jgi:hypothetical protein
VTVISSATVAGLSSTLSWSVRAAASATFWLRVCIPSSSNVTV